MYTPQTPIFASTFVTTLVSSLLLVVTVEGIDIASYNCFTQGYLDQSSGPLVPDAHLRHGGPGHLRSIPRLRPNHDQES